MHILITNDDGPPSPQTSPYVRCLVHLLQQCGHLVSVCLPHTQRSWIGKAHMIGQTVKPLYYRPSKELHGEASLGTVHHRPSPDAAVEEWILVDGTPASCVQIGLHHFFENRPPIDLVVSGPNYGRNTTAVFALSSGTLGAAMEAAVCRWRAVALSFAFFTRNHDPEIIEAACRHSVKVIEALWKAWPTDGSVDLYSVNVPLVEGVEKHRTMWTDMLQNYWSLGSCFQEVEGSVGGEEEEEERIREGVGGEAANGEAANGEGLEAGTKTGTGGHRHKHFKWAPKFGDVYKSVEDAGPGNDGWAVKEGHTSVTPLKANFRHGATELHGKELELSSAGAVTSGLSTLQITEQDPIYALVHYEDDYVQPILTSTLRRLYPAIKLIPPPSSTCPSSDSAATEDSQIHLSPLVPTPSTRLLSITQYEAVDFSFAAEHPTSCLINSYTIRKALIRKHFLSATVEAWVAKRPSSVLGAHVRRSEGFEVDYAEFLDDSLTECFDLRAGLEKNQEAGSEREKEWWILKPGMSDRGQGIKLFSTMEELQGIFDKWDEERPASDDGGDEDEGEEANENEVVSGTAKDYITTSHLRHFIAQPYIHPPLLVDSTKFHIRTYVLALGRFQVYVYNKMLALFAPSPYVPPWEDASPSAHLTNTCLQGTSPDSSSVRLFDDLPLSDSLKESIRREIGEVVGEAFEAAARSMTIHFQPLHNAFEVFGVDFLVDAEGRTWLLEVNSFPDFKQTGGGLKRLVEGLWEGVLGRVIGSFFASEVGGRGGDGGCKESDHDDGMVLVREVELSNAF